VIGNFFDICHWTLDFFNMEKKLSVHLVVGLVLISLIVGGSSGVLGGLLIAPILQNSDLGQKLFKQNIQNNTKTFFEINQDSATISAVEKTAPAVVSIVVTKELNNFYNQTGPFWFFGNNSQPDNNTQEKEKQQIGGGTGFLVSPDGLILTNKHVVADDAAEYSVILNDGREFEAKVLGKDLINDLAVLKIDGQDLPVLTLSDSDQIQIGQTVIAIGYTLGEYENTVTRGVISGVNRTVTAGDGYSGAEVIEEALQTDAAINPGNSGGPLLNLAGEVIGINTAVNLSGESIGFAIPINVAKSVVDSVSKYGKIVRPYLGVRYVNLTEKIATANNLAVNYGALIIRGQNPEDLAVSPSSPADKAGIEENDIILEINGKKLDQVSLAYELQRYNVGDEIVLKILHDGNEKEVKVKLEERK
jgi:serine protease Do